MSDKGKDANSSENVVFDWIELRKELGSSDVLVQEESAKDKFFRKFKETPLVPIGAFVTCLFLGFGLRAMKTGNRRQSQLMMRGRIIAQAFTLVAVVSSLGYTAIEK